MLSVQKRSYFVRATSDKTFSSFSSVSNVLNLYLFAHILLQALLSDIPRHIQHLDVAFPSMH